ncbi:MAG: hypothetical protein P8N76_28395 [Pirellulaceae bacterium]|nr:hypothetical protein [Pirellulaceae bacterium]
MMAQNRLTRFQLDEFAKRQLADYDAHCPGTLFAEGVEFTIEQAYEIQAAIADLRCDRGEQVIGYKVGCTSAKVRAQLGIDHCITGRLFNSEMHQSGTTLSRSNFTNLAIEGELAVQLSREPIATDFIAGQIPTCVSHVVPVIELHHHVIRGKQPSAGELVANNAIHAGFVWGDELKSTGVEKDSSLQIFSNDRLLDQCDGAPLIDTINSSLAWLTEVVRQRGDQLQAGQIILTGSIPSLLPITDDCTIRVEAPGFGRTKAELN